MPLNHITSDTQARSFNFEGIEHLRRQAGAGRALSRMEGGEEAGALMEPEVAVNVPAKDEKDGHEEEGELESSPLLDLAAKHVDEYLRLAFGAGKPENSILQTVVLLVNSSIGSGILNQPYVFKEAGIGGACIMYPIAALVTWAGLFMLVDAGHKTGATDYGGVAEAAFGPYGSYTADVALLVLCYGCLCSYLVAIGGLATSLIQAWSKYSTFYASEVFITLMAGVLLLPICLARHYGHMVPTASYSLVAISLVVILVVAYGPIQGASSSGESLTWLSGVGSVRALGSIVFSLSCSHATFHASMGMEDQSFAAWNLASGVSVAISTALCFITGLVGYLSFRSDTEGEILDNFTWVGAQAFKIFLIIHLLLYIGPDFIILRYSTLTLWNLSPSKVSTMVHVLSTALLLSSVVVLVIVLYLLDLSEGQAFNYIIDLTGATAAACISFILPGAIAWKLHGLDTWVGRAGAALAVFGGAVAVLVPAFLFTDD